jgi:hypothetical protein
MDALFQNRQHWREVMLARQQLEKEQLVRDYNAVEIKQAEPCRTREAFQATTSKSIASPKHYPIGPEISFEFPTFLAFPISPSDREHGTTSVGSSTGKSQDDENVKPTENGPAQLE